MLRIVFMGTPAFAVASLDALFHSHHQIEAVVTTPDKPAGRGRKISESDVKKYCMQQDLPLLQPLNLKDAAFIDILKGINPDLIVVVAFRMLPRSVWSIPALGTINLHASLLPAYRGAAPINHAIIKGETETGLSTFLINDQIDTGDILMQKKISIFSDDDFGSLHDRMKEEGKVLLLDTLDRMERNEIEPLTQNQMKYKPSFAPKLTKENTRINWEDVPERICRLIRGLSPTPGAWSTIAAQDGEMYSVKIFDAEPYEDLNDHTAIIGKILSDGKSFIAVKSNGGFVKINKIQLSGRGVMQTPDFLRGYAGLISGAVLK